MGETIFWDFDGTLVYSPHLWSHAMYDALKEQMPDYPGTFEDIRAAASGKICSWDTPPADGEDIRGMKWWEFTEKRFYEGYLKLGVPENAAWRAAAGAHREILNPDRYRLYEDTIEVLKESRRRGHRNYILSNNYPDMDQVMEKIGLLAYFDGMVVSANEGVEKPDPQIFKIALQTAGNPEDCWMIGDNPVADMKGAKAVGMHTVLVHRDIPCEYADAVLQSLSEVFSAMRV